MFSPAPHHTALPAASAGHGHALAWPAVALAASWIIGLATSANPAHAAETFRGLYIVEQSYWIRSLNELDRDTWHRLQEAAASGRLSVNASAARQRWAFIKANYAHGNSPRFTWMRSDVLEARLAENERKLADALEYEQVGDKEKARKALESSGWSWYSSARPTPYVGIDDLFEDTCRDVLNRYVEPSPLVCCSLTDGSFVADKAVPGIDNSRVTYEITEPRTQKWEPADLATYASLRAQKAQFRNLIWLHSIYDTGEVNGWIFRHVFLVQPARGISPDTVLGTLVRSLNAREQGALTLGGVSMQQITFEKEGDMRYGLIGSGDWVILLTADDKWDASRLTDLASRFITWAKAM